MVYVLANMGIWTLSSSRKSFFLLFACSCDAVDAALRQQLQADVQAVHALAVSAALRLNNPPPILAPPHSFSPAHPPRFLQLGRSMLKKKGIPLEIIDAIYGRVMRSRCVVLRR